MTISHDQVKRGVVVKHRNGNVYIVLRVIGVKSADRDYYEVEYLGTNGREWKRELVEFCNSMTIMYDGSTKAIDRIADRRYPAPLANADWTVSSEDVVAVTLAIAGGRHITSWPGATDDQMTAVAREIIAALDQPVARHKAAD